MVTYGCLAVGESSRWDEASNHFVDIAPQSPSLRYRSLLWDSAGFWIREDERVHCFTQGRFVDFTLPRQILKDDLWGAALDQSGTLWLETVDGKRVRITADNVSQIIPAALPGK